MIKRTLSNVPASHFSFRRYVVFALSNPGKRWTVIKSVLAAVCLVAFGYVKRDLWKSKQPTEMTDAEWVVVIMGGNHMNQTPCEFAELVKRGLTPLTQEDLDYFAENVQLNFTVVENGYLDSLLYQSELRLTNNGNRDFPEEGWSIIFSQAPHLISLLAPGKYPYPNGLTEPKYGVRFKFLMGNVYQMMPISGFGTLRSGQSKVIRWTSEHFNTAVTDNYPNWFIEAPNLQPRTIENTRGENLDFVAPYTAPSKWKRYPVEGDKLFDEYNPFTPQDRYVRYQLGDVQETPIPVIPTPVNVLAYNNQSTLNVLTGSWIVVTSPRLANEGRFLADHWSMTMAVRPPSSHFVQIVEANVQVTYRDRVISTDESYELRVNPSTNVILIRAAQPAGAFYAIQTLISLADETGNIPETAITDGPRYPYRGLMLDMARNFFPKEVIFRVIDLMAMYKLNKLHLHLTDDEGWRLAIPGLEELTGVGATRCYDLSETRCLLPFLGAGPFPGPPGSGHYTVEDYRDILRYAVSRHVEVIPEIDMPGHAHAAIKAMEARYKRLVNLNVSEASRFLLSDLGDESVYMSIQSFTDNALNPCLRSTYTFISRILNSLFAMHRDISPLKMFHFGGDEVAKGAWQNSPVCQRLRESGVTMNLREYLARQVANMSSLYNLDIAAWEDGLTGDEGLPIPRTSLPNRDVYAYAWNNVFEFGNARRAYDYANEGYKVVVAPATNLYLDHPYEPDPQSRGLYWATRFIDTKRVFSVNPEHLYWNAETTRYGKELEICKNDSVCPPLREPGNIEGIQATLFGENIRSQSIMDSMLLPRLLAAAERAWHAAPWEWQENDELRNSMLDRDWASFVHKVARKELARLDRRGYRYRIPPPGAIVVDGVMKTSTEFPGLQVEMSSDGGSTWTKVSPSGDRVDTDKQYLLRTKSAWGSRYSRVIPLYGDVNKGNKLQMTLLYIGVALLLNLLTC